VLKKPLILIVFAPKFTNLFVVAMAKPMEMLVRLVAIILQSLRKENARSKKNIVYIKLHLQVFFVRGWCSTGRELLE
jgi:hypothetical protein